MAAIEDGEALGEFFRSVPRSFMGIIKGFEVQVFGPFGDLVFLALR